LGRLPVAQRHKESFMSGVLTTLFIFFFFLAHV
jgi:hypothetical protein